MNRTKIILAAIGGVAVVGALVLGYLIWDAASASAEKAEALDAALAQAKGIIRKLPIKAEPKELAVYRENAAVYSEWRENAGRLAARGDLVFENTTPAVLKTILVGEARRLAAMPGCEGGRLVKADFPFGFRDYIVGGALPPDNPAELKRLQREWNDVSSVIATLAECGGTRITIDDVRLGKAKVAEEEEADSAKSKKAKAKAKAKSKAKAKAAEADEAQGPAITSFAVDFRTTPAALVKALNAFATSPRFIVVESCTFVRESDALAEALGGDAKKAEASSPRTRRRRAAASAEAAETKDEGPSGVVTDPATAPLLKVTMAFSVYDFGTLEKAKAEGAGAEEDKGGAK